MSGPTCQAIFGLTNSIGCGKSKRKEDMENTHIRYESRKLWKWPAWATQPTVIVPSSFITMFSPRHCDSGSFAFYEVFWTKPSSVVVCRPDADLSFWPVVLRFPGTYGFCHGMISVIIHMRIKNNGSRVRGPYRLGTWTCPTFVQWKLQLWVRT